MRKQPFTVLVDSSEKTPWSFPSEHKVVRSNLRKYGADYTVRGQSGIIGVERKAWQDYILCLGKEWQRFQKSLRKLATNRFRCVIVEGLVDDKILHSRMKLGALLARTSFIMTRRIPVLFCGNAWQAQNACMHFFNESIRRTRL